MKIWGFEDEGGIMEYKNLSFKKADTVSEWSNSHLTGARDLVQDKRRFASLILIAIAVLFGVLAAAKTMGFFINSVRAQRIVKQATAWSKTDPNAMDGQSAKSRLIAEDLKQNNLFWPTPKENPVKAVMGIFGDEAYIDGQWYKVGAMIKDAKIIAIGADSVTTEWNGQKQVFYPIDAGGPPAPASPMPGPDRPLPMPNPTGEKRPVMVGGPQLSGQTRPK
jgi:hypothetical protein